MTDQQKLAAIEQVVADIPMTRRTLTVQKLIQQIHAILWDKTDDTIDQVRRAYDNARQASN